MAVSRSFLPGVDLSHIGLDLNGIVIRINISVTTTWTFNSAIKNGSLALACCQSSFVTESILFVKVFLVCCRLRFRLIISSFLFSVWDFIFFLLINSSHDSPFACQIMYNSQEARVSQILWLVSHKWGKKPCMCHLATIYNVWMLSLSTVFIFLSSVLTTDPTLTLQTPHRALLCSFSDHVLQLQGS